MSAIRNLAPVYDLEPSRIPTPTVIVLDDQSTGRLVLTDYRMPVLDGVFDALTTARPYKLAWEWQTAVDYIVQQKGKHFDPELVEVFVENLDEARVIQQSLADNGPAGSTGR